MAKTILDDAKDAVYGDRNRDYGPPGPNHWCTATMIRAYLLRRYQVDLPLDATDICWMNALQKISRDAYRRKRDNKVDVAGFAENAQQSESP